MDEREIKQNRINVSGRYNEAVPGILSTPSLDMKALTSNRIEWCYKNSHKATGHKPRSVYNAIKFKLGMVLRWNILWSNYQWESCLLDSLCIPQSITSISLELIEEVIAETSSISNGRVNEQYDLNMSPSWDIKLVSSFHSKYHGISMQLHNYSIFKEWIRSYTGITRQYNLYSKVTSYEHLNG